MTRAAKTRCGLVVPSVRLPVCPVCPSARLPRMFRWPDASIDTNASGVERPGRSRRIYSSATAKARSAAGAPDRPAREGTPTRLPAVRVTPGAPPERWPRASSRPRWPDDAKPIAKNLTNFPSECLTPARHARGAADRGTLRSEVKEEEAAGRRGTRAEKSPPSRRAPPQRAPQKPATSNPQPATSKRGKPVKPDKPTQSQSTRIPEDQVDFEILIVGNFALKSLALAATVTATCRATAL